MNTENNKNTKDNNKTTKEQSSNEASRDWYLKPMTKEELEKLPIPQ